MKAKRNGTMDLMKSTFRGLFAASAAIAVACGALSGRAQVSGEYPQVDPSTLGISGSFWKLSKYDTNVGRFLEPPLPFNPLLKFGVTNNVDVFQMGTNSYIIDDIGLDWDAIHQQWMEANGEERLMSVGEAMFESSGNGGGPMTPDYTSSSNQLYLEVTDRSRITNGWIGVTLHNTIADLAYDLLYRLSLTNKDGWAVDQQVIGAENATDTFTWVSMTGRTNQLFLWARSYVDTDGDGLPDWWELKYGLDPNNPDTGNTGIPDGYKDLAGDGWTTIYKYEHGLNPTNPITPPPPRNVQAKLDANGSNVVVTWESGGGNVTGYGIAYGYDPYGAYFSEIHSNGPATFTFTHHLGYSVTGLYSPPSYVVRAYSGTNHADSLVASPTRWDLEGDSVFRMRGPNAYTYLMVQSPAPDLGRIVLFEFPSESPITVYASNLVNGVMKSPVSEADTYLYGWFRLFSTNGDLGHGGNTYYESDRDRIWFSGTTMAYRFVDARRHMKENLKFLVRAATASHAYSFTADQNTQGGSGWYPFLAEETNPEYYFAKPETSTDYEYYGFHVYDPSLGYSLIQELRPIYDNYLLHNLVFDDQLLDQTGILSNDDCDVITRMIWGAYYSYLSPGNETNAPLSLATSNAAFSFSGWADYLPRDCYTLRESGLSLVGTNMALASNAKNCFGLSISSVKFYGADGVHTLAHIALRRDQRRTGVFGN